MRKFAFTAMAVFVSAITFAQTVSDFENLTLPTDTFWNGSDLSGDFASGNAFFKNVYDVTYNSWSGFSYSNRTDSNTAGWGNQYSAITASGFGGSANYAVANAAVTSGYVDAKVKLTGNAAGKFIEGFYITNATYAYLSMRDGDDFSKQFGGTSGNDEDWFKLTVKGWLNGAQKLTEVEFYLADYRFADNSQDYLVRDWQWVNLLPLGTVDSIQFFLSSSDVGDWGMNTPAYFCIDNFTTSDVVYAAPTASDLNVSLIYPITDTLIELPVTAALSYTVSLLSEPKVFGATASIDNATQKLLYTPAVGIIANDTLVYKVTDDAGNTDSATVYIAVVDTTASGINDTYLSQISVYPNPFASQVFVRGITHETEAELYSSTGALLHKETLNADGTLNVSGLSTGLYVLKLQNGNTLSAVRLIKQ